MISDGVWAQPSGGNPKPQVLFTIQGVAVYTNEFSYLYKKNHLKPEDFTEPKINEYIDLLINFKLKVREAVAHGLDTTAAFRKEFKTYRDELKKPYLSEQNELDRLTLEAYQRMKEEVRASHILIGVSPEAKPADTLAPYNKALEIRARILGGEDFEKAARAFSEDPSAKANGGNLGYFSVLQMVYPFEQAAYTLKQGEVSLPVRTRFGYHLIKVTDRRPARGEVEVSHIIIRAGQGDNTKLKNKILEIFDQLQGGRSWDELCKEYSDDPATRDQGGRLKPFGVGALPGVPEFETVAFALKTPGEISDPFQTAYGWHIVRLERKIPVPAYGDAEATLRRKVSRDERLQVAEGKLMDQRKRQFGLIEDKEVLQGMLALADSTLCQGKWNFRGESALRSQTLCTLENKGHTVNEFIAFIRSNQRASRKDPAACMTELYNGYLNGKLEDAEDAWLTASNPEFRNLLTEYREGILLFTIMEEEVWNKAPADTAGLKAFYMENKEKYRAGDRVRARVLTTTDEHFLTEIRGRIAAGDSLKPADLKKFKSIQPWRNYERGDNKGVDHVTWTVGLQSTEVDKTYYLVEIESLVPPGAKTFEEARGQVVSEYQSVVESKWVAALKVKYPVKINNKGRKFVVAELTKK